MEPRGNIQKLSVAVLVDGKYEKDKYIARTTAEMDIIKGMVKRAVGFDSDRGDEIEIANVPFKVQPVSPLAPLGAPELKDMLMSPMGIGIGVGALLLIGGVLFFVMRGKKKPAAMEQRQQHGAARSRADRGDRAGRGSCSGAEDRGIAGPAQRTAFADCP